MKKLFAVIAAFGLAATMAFAQDYNEAVDAFNAGAQAIETNKTEALANFRAGERQPLGNVLLTNARKPFPASSCPSPRKRLTTVPTTRPFPCSPKPRP